MLNDLNGVSDKHAVLISGQFYDYSFSSQTQTLTNQSV